MHNPGLWVAALAGVMVIETGAARAEDNPLLVVVEAQPGLGVDAADVRQRIAGELRQRVVSPSDPAAPRASQVLIVSLDADDIRISVRNGAEARVSRAIPNVTERAARLRAVAWLAGNLARDQVGPLLPGLALAPTATPAAEPAKTAAPPTPRPAITDPPNMEPPSLKTTDAPLSGRAASSESNIPAQWSITASGGATLTDGCLHLGLNPVTCGPTGGGGSPLFFGSSYQLEVQHHTANEGTIVGGTLDSGPDRHLVGLAGLIGIRRPWGRWYLEATLGAGIEAERVTVTNTTVVSSSVSGVSDNTTVSSQVQPVLYARAGGSIGIPINQTFDFMVRLTIHLASSGFATDFMGATAGLRLKLL